ncbi:MAG: phosphotransferase [Caldimonas sp.]
MTNAMQVAAATPEAILRLLGEPIAAALRIPARSLQLLPIDGVTPRADAPAVLRVVDAAAKPRAVVLCSAPTFPDMVERAMSRAAQARSRLAPAEAAAILRPLLEGRVDGLSYSILPHCDTLSAHRWKWRLQRALLGPRLLDWLYRVTADTVALADEAQCDARFAAPLACLASLDRLSAPVRADTAQAASRLREGSWQPRHVLMHGDLWKGNILIEPGAARPGRTRWRDRFVVIDWPGSEMHGHAIYDLIRLARSMRTPDAALRAEVQRHCDLLGAATEDAMAYLLSALGYIALHLEEFPMDKYLPMVEACHADLRRILASTDRS